jgi:uncharacterized cupredoxin-like copper-binding protein
MAMQRTLLVVLAATAALVTTHVAIAHGDEDHAPAHATTKQQTDWGIAGDAGAASRSIPVTMLDTMRFVPEQISVKRGETIRFQIKNEGAMLHEFVIGTQKVLDAHAEMMAKHPDMQHSEPYMAHVAPGKTKELVWTFNRPGTFDFACLIAGHYQAGMKGRITVAAK